MLAAEVYEDGLGGLILFAIDGGDPVWACRYVEGFEGYAPEELCAMDLCGIAVQGIDPREEGWEGGADPSEWSRVAGFPVAWGSGVDYDDSALVEPGFACCGAL